MKKKDNVTKAIFMLIHDITDLITMVQDIQELH